MMYEIVLFSHILGTVLMFTAVGITLTAMAAMLKAEKTETLRIWSAMAVKMDGLLPLSTLLILLPGLYLVITTWGWQMAWINISLALLVGMSVAGPVINLKRLKRILETAEKSDELSPGPELTMQVRDRTLWSSVLTMTMMTVAILFLMTVKVGLVGSLTAIVLALLVGLTAAQLLLHQKAAVEVS
ncbi:hypothetical protein [Planococcus lenghuensis]|uniref:DUF2269 family protein n=1 Tax=Planococcus lenghuensis TaxID=2213202 RepID=A0A1Q2L355_9BACL|nr:hypothetical protein [Planococcus lenghuensis]AQQ54843.1 hypothetical protein B0X71_18205 [Planococcus lenghuensis]